MLDLTTRDPREIRALREELPDQAVRVLIRAPLPRTMRVGEVDLDAGLLREQLVLGHLFALVVGEGPRHLLGQGAHLPGEGLPDTRRILRSQGHQEGGAGRPLHERAQRRGAPAPHDQIPLPVAGHRPIRHLRGALFDAQHRGDVATSLRTAAARPPVRPSVPERPEQRPLELAAGQHVHVRVDRLVRHAHRGIIRILRLQPRGNLLRRPALRQLRVHVGLEARVRQELPRPLRRPSRDVLASRGPVGAPCPLRPAQFPSDCAGGSSELPRNRSQTASSRQLAADLLAFGERQACVASHRAQLLSPGWTRIPGVALRT